MKMFAKAILFLFIASAISKAYPQKSIGEHTLQGTRVIELTDEKTNRTYRLSIQTPHDYQEGIKKDSKYPVMYITDSAYNFPIVEGWMNVATYENTVKKHILVGISRDIGISSRESRSRDFTPIIDTEWQVKTGEADSHIRFIREQVIKYVEDNYVVSTGDRTYIGSSLGGLFGAYIFLTQPDLFSNYVLISPSLWYDDGYMFRLLNSQKIVKPKKSTKIFLSAGELETPEAAGIRNNLFTDAQKFTGVINGWGNTNVSARFYSVDDAFHSMTFPESLVRAIYWMHGIEKIRKEM